MNFIPLTKYLDSFHNTYNLPGCDCCVYYNHNNVFRRKYGFSDAKKTSFKDLYFMHSAAKLICSAAVIQLCEKGLLSLDDKVCKFIEGFDDSITVKDMLKNYSQTFDYEQHKFNHKSIGMLIRAASGLTLNAYIEKFIFMPLHMKNSSFELNNENRKRISAQYVLKNGERVMDEKSIDELFSQNEGCLITSVGDYARFAEALCNGGISKHNERILSADSIKRMINEIVYNETTEKNCFVCVGYNGSLISIDPDNHVTIVYAQHVKNCGITQMEIYPELRKRIYDCLGIHKWSKGFNIFP